MFTSLSLPDKNIAYFALPSPSTSAVTHRGPQCPIMFGNSVVGKQQFDKYPNKSVCSCSVFTIPIKNISKYHSFYHFVSDMSDHECTPESICKYCKVRNIGVELLLATLASGSDSLILRSVYICSIFQRFFFFF